MFQKPTHAYIGRKWCGCAVGSAADLGDKTTARWVADFIKDGLTVERVPLAEALLVWECPHGKKPSGLPEQLPLAASGAPDGEADA